ncbi:MAG: signal peptidase I [Chlorobi bacterium]|nr:signal peptidase I [Chlorobiota bacterium]
MPLLLLLVSSVTVAFVVRTVGFSIYVIPTRSMEPSLFAGDVVLVNKLGYWLGVPPTVPLTDIVLSRPIRIQWSKPRRGDVVVFRFAYHAEYPTEPDYFVKRIVGMPGDTLWVVGDSVYAYRAKRRMRTTPQQRYAGAVVVPAAGMTIELSPKNAEYWRPFIEREGCRLECVRNVVLLDGQLRSKYTFVSDHYYVLGDHRSNSFDSRYWGFVSEMDIIGKPVLVLWSKSPTLGTIRWERFGTVPQ